MEPRADTSKIDGRRHCRLNGGAEIIAFPGPKIRWSAFHPEAIHFAADRVSAFIFLHTDSSRSEQEITGRLAALEEVEEIHLVDGEDCILIKVSAPDREALARLLGYELRACGDFDSIRTLTVLSTLKDGAPRLTPSSKQRQAAWDTPPSAD